MTLARAEKEARLGPQADSETTMAGDCASAFGAIARAATTLRWPSSKYATDPTGFARDIVAIELWEGQQGIANSVVENRHTSVRSGHKVGKSLVCAILALWFFCTFPEAKVWLVGPNGKTIDDVIWDEIKRLIQRSGTCLSCRRAAEEANPEYPDYPRPCPHSAIIPEEPHVSSLDGLVSDDFRRIKGCTAEKPEAMAGRSGMYILYIVDEASGVDDKVDEVIQGNLASRHARLIYISNPTRTEGFFYESQTSKKHLYSTFHISSERVIALGLKDVALATEEWRKGQIAKYGIDSGQYRIRVLGEFAPEHTHQVIPRPLIDDAILRWPLTVAEGPLHLGVDVALMGNDDTAIAVRRGLKILEVPHWNGLSETAVAERIIETAEEHRDAVAREVVIAKIDAAGVGTRVIAALHERKPRWLQVVPLHGAETPRLPNEYAYLSDQIIFAARQWLREGGALPNDDRLAAELHTWTYSLDVRGRRKVESKEHVRKRLKRSPDLADAVCLAVWDENQFQPAPFVIPAQAVTPPRPPPAAVYGAHRPSGDAVYGASRRPSFPR